ERPAAVDALGVRVAFDGLLDDRLYLVVGPRHRSRLVFQLLAEAVVLVAYAVQFGAQLDVAFDLLAKVGKQAVVLVAYAVQFGAQLDVAFDLLAKVGKQAVVLVAYAVQFGAQLDVAFDLLAKVGKQAVVLVGEAHDDSVSESDGVWKPLRVFSACIDLAVKLILCHGWPPSIIVADPLPTIGQPPLHLPLRLFRVVDDKRAVLLGVLDAPCA